MSIWETYGTYIKAALVGLLLLIIFLAGKGWLDGREDRIRLDEQLKATKQLLADRDKRLAEADHRMEVRDKELKQSLKENEELKARPATIREIVKKIPRFIPLESPPSLTQPSPSAPEAPPKIEFDEGQAQDLRKFYLDCNAKTLRLEACEGNAEDWKRKEILWQEKEQVLEQQRDAAIRAVKGGSFWTRFKRNAKWFLIGGAVGAGAGVLAASR